MLTAPPRSPARPACASTPPNPMRCVRGRKFPPNTPGGSKISEWVGQWREVEYSGAKWRTADLEWGKGEWPVFLGTHTPKLDEKGRLILPAKYRDELSDGLVITRFQERCLAIWPRAVFVEVAQTVRSASSSQQHVRDYQRMLASGA